MRHSRSWFLFIFLYHCTFSFAQTVPQEIERVTYLESTDSIFVQRDDAGKFHMIYSIERGQTLFSLARTFGVKLDELYSYNPDLLGKVVGVGQEIRVPLKPSTVLTERKNLFQDAAYVPVFYRVRSKETLFRVSRVYFQLPVDTLRNRNHLMDNSISIGQSLHVGWLNAAGIPDSLQDFSKTNTIRTTNSSGMQQAFMVLSNKQKMVQEKGAASWNKRSKAAKGMYALHRTAPINSIMRVFNPLTEKAVYVKVISRINEKLVKDDVVLQLSSEAARNLGAMDARFYVKINFLEEG